MAQVRSSLLSNLTTKRTNSLLYLEVSRSTFHLRKGRQSIPVFRRKEESRSSSTVTRNTLLLDQLSLSITRVTLVTRVRLRQTHSTSPRRRERHYQSIRRVREKRSLEFWTKKLKVRMQIERRATEQGTTRGLYLVQLAELVENETVSCVRSVVTLRLSRKKREQNKRSGLLLYNYDDQRHVDCTYRATVRKYEGSTCEKLVRNIEKKKKSVCFRNPKKKNLMCEKEHHS